MKYVSMEAALNRKCLLNTCGDWHRECYKMNKVLSTYEPLNEWGIEYEDGQHYANHLRAIIDYMVYNDNFNYIIDFYKDYIVVNDYDEEFMENVYRIKSIVTQDKWEEIDSLMLRNMKLKWARFQRNKRS